VRCAGAKQCCFRFAPRKTKISPRAESGAAMSGMPVLEGLLTAREINRQRYEHTPSMPSPKPTPAIGHRAGRGEVVCFRIDYVVGLATRGSHQVSWVAFALDADIRGGSFDIRKIRSVSRRWPQLRFFQTMNLGRTRIGTIQAFVPGATQARSVPQSHFCARHVLQ